MKIINSATGLFAAVLAVGILAAPSAQADGHHSLGLGVAEWTEWERLERQCGVELQVRYHVGKRLFKGWVTGVQFRYINHSPCPRTASVRNVILNFKDLKNTRIWNGELYQERWGGETVRVGGHDTAYGAKHVFPGRLWNFRYGYRVR